MTATNHALTGAVIALSVKQPALAIPLALLSHFAADALPHFGIHPGNVFKRNHTLQFRTVLTVDIVLGSAVGIYLLFFLHSSISFWTLAACMFAAASPDLIWGYRFFREIVTKKYKPPKDWFSRFHLGIQWSETPPGIVVELLWFGGMLTLTQLLK